MVVVVVVGGLSCEPEVSDGSNSLHHENHVWKYHSQRMESRGGGMISRCLEEKENHLEEIKLQMRPGFIYWSADRCAASCLV